MYIIRGMDSDIWLKFGCTEYRQHTWIRRLYCCHFKDWYGMTTSQGWSCLGEIWHANTIHGQSHKVRSNCSNKACDCEL